MSNCYFRPFFWMLGCGLIFGFLISIFFDIFGIAIPILGECFNAPAIFFVWLWFDKLELPPRGEMGFILPFLAMFAQWFLVGAFIGLWRYRKMQRKANAPKEKDM